MKDTNRRFKTIGRVHVQETKQLWFGQNWSFYNWQMAKIIIEWWQWWLNVICIIGWIHIRVVEVYKWSKQNSCKRQSIHCYCSRQNSRDETWGTKRWITRYFSQLPFANTCVCVCIHLLVYLYVYVCSREDKRRKERIFIITFCWTHWTILVCTSHCLSPPNLSWWILWSTISWWQSCETKTLPQ